VIKFGHGIIDQWHE